MSGGSQSLLFRIRKVNAWGTVTRWHAVCRCPLPLCLLRSQLSVFISPSVVALLRFFILVFILGLYKRSDSLREIASCLYPGPTCIVGRQGSNVGDKTRVWQAQYVDFRCSGQNCGCIERMKTVTSVLIMSNLSDWRGVLVASTSTRESRAVGTGQGAASISRSPD